MMGVVPGSLGKPVLGRQRVNRRAVLKSVLALMITAPAGRAYHYLPVSSWRADYRTSVGESRTVRLPDGSHLILNTDSAADIAFDEGSRRIILQRGEIFIETAPDTAETQRKFIVETKHGSVTALGTRFIVRGGRDEDVSFSQVIVLEDAVLIQPTTGTGPIRLDAGEMTDFSYSIAAPPVPTGASETAWLHGRIIADRIRLGDLVVELARYRIGILRCDPVIADLPISGVFQTTKIDEALSIIAETLPVSIRRVTPFWITLIPAK